MNIELLRKKTEEGRKAAEAKKKLEEIEAIKKAEKARLEEEKRRKEIFKQTIKYIEEQIFKAAEKGESSYVYDFGSRPYPGLIDKVKQYFEKLKLKVSGDSCHHHDIDNYDMGTYNDYCTSGLCFSW